MHFVFFLIIYQAKSQFKRRSTANNVEIILPVPADADSPKFKTTVGSCKYAPDQNSVLWTVKSFPVSTCELVESVILPQTIVFYYFSLLDV